MMTRSVALLIIAALTTFAVAQTAPPATLQTGEVIGDNVYVRSGAGKDTYPCGKLSRPAKITVAGERNGWYMLVSPPGCFSVVSQTYVERSTDGKTGTVTGDNVWVRAGGDEHRGDFSYLQKSLNRGDTVEIIGEVSDTKGKWYKINPPQGAYFFMSVDYVRLSGAAAPAATPAAGANDAAVAVVTVEPVDAPPADATTEPASQPTTEPVNVLERIAAEPDVTVALESFKTAEKALTAEYAKPLEQRNLPAVLALYEAIKTPDNSALIPYLEARTQFLKYAIEQKNNLEIAEELMQQTAHRQRMFELERAKIEVVLPTQRPVTAYAAQGLLMESAIFPGNAAAPKRYMVRDVDTLKVNAYVQCTSGTVDLSQYVAQVVGVIGATQFDKGLRLDVVEAREVVVLKQQVSLPAPPQPIVKPRPQTAPTSGANIPDTGLPVVE